MAKGTLSGQHFKRRESQRIQVGSRVQRTPLDHFGGHVSWRSRNLFGRGQADSLHQAKIQQDEMLATIARHDQDIRRLDVPMKKTPLVNETQGAQELHDQIEEPTQWEWFASGQWTSLDQFHDEIGGRAIRKSVINDLWKIHMPKGCHRQEFLPKSQPPRLIVILFWMSQLECSLRAVQLVVDTVNRPHAAGSQAIQYRIPPRNDAAFGLCFRFIRRIESLLKP